jgi:hypothetical protein
VVGQPITFDDGAAYERQIGVWSRFAGEIFLDWLAPDIPDILYGRQPCDHFLHVSSTYS